MVTGETPAAGSVPTLYLRSPPAAALGPGKRKWAGGTAPTLKPPPGAGGEVAAGDPVGSVCHDFNRGQGKGGATRHRHGVALTRGARDVPPGKKEAGGATSGTYQLGDGDALAEEDAGRPHQPVQHRVVLQRRRLRGLRRLLGLLGAGGAAALPPVLRAEPAGNGRHPPGNPHPISNPPPRAFNHPTGPALPWRASAQGSWCSCPWLGGARASLAPPGGVAWRSPGGRRLRPGRARTGVFL